MKMVLRKSTIPVMLFVLLASLSVACGGTPTSPSPSPTAIHTYPVAPQFRELYAYLGGNATLGPAISDVILNGNLSMQYTEKALMVYDPYAPSDRQHYLAPLGKEFGFLDPPVPMPQAGGPLYVDGHIVYADFVSLYEELGGVRYAGKPLTEVRYNPDENRLEQHFENVGIYQSLINSIGEPELLYYGVEACGYQCRRKVPSDGAAQPIENALPEPFASTVGRLGQTFVGEYLFGPYEAEDGNQEVIFGNLVLYALPDDPNRAYARPISKLVGYEERPLVESLDSQLVYFFRIEGDLGHNIPILFYDYIAQHGGIDVSGYPITEIFPYQDNIYRQCFENLCLDSDPNAAEGQQVHLVNLGSIYKTLFINPSPQATEEPGSKVQIQLWEESPLIDSDHVQTIHATIIKDGMPVEKVVPDIELTLPDDTRSVYVFPPTNSGGAASLSVPAIKAPNGALITYEVCVKDGDAGETCVEDSYIIWGN